MLEEMFANQDLVDSRYAVRGPTALRGRQLAEEGVVTIPANIGNPQGVGLDWFDYLRQIFALVAYPALLQDPRFNGIESRFDSSNVARAREILENTGGIGPYTHEQGELFYRQMVANFINRRDKFVEESPFAASVDDVYLTNGASEAAEIFFQAALHNSSEGVMMPRPTYSIYPALVKMSKGSEAYYDLDPESDWGVSRESLEKGYYEAVDRGIVPKILVDVNPGNPNPSIHSTETMDDITLFAAEKDLIIWADEVYQANSNGRFVSYRERIYDLVQTGKIDKGVPIASVHSASKGPYGECGLRAGYMELKDMPEVIQKTKLTALLQRKNAMRLNSNTSGQLVTSLMTNPPTEEEDSYERYMSQREKTLGTIRRNIEILEEGFADMAVDGIHSAGKPVSMYRFPRLPPEVEDDLHYAIRLVENTGLVTVEGSGFGKQGYLRVAALPANEIFEAVMPRWKDFNRRYVKGEFGFEFTPEERVFYGI